jgi:hypothetical protein
MRNFISSLVVCILVAGCGGGGTDENASLGAKAQAALARATVAASDPENCIASPESYATIEGVCTQLFDGIDVVRHPATSESAPKASRPRPSAQRASAPKSAAAVPVLTPTALFNWASGPYSIYFAGPYYDGSIYLPGYGTFTYRYFAWTGNFLGVLDGWVYVYGPMTFDLVLAVAPLADFTCYVYSCTRSFISWNGNANGVVVKDANGDSFAFYADTGCLYSYARGQEITNYCLVSGSMANFAGTYVYVDLVAAVGGGCIAALADYWGEQIDVYTNAYGQLAFATTPYFWNYGGCG